MEQKTGAPATRELPFLNTTKSLIRAVAASPTGNNDRHCRKQENVENSVERFACSRHDGS